MTTRSTPVPVKNITNATQVSAGLDHTCARLSTSALKCWGLASDGELGDGAGRTPSTEFVFKPTPVAVRAVATATQVSAGDNYTCALLSNHTVKCWGNNGSGQLGDGQSGEIRTVPVSVIHLP